MTKIPIVKIHRYSGSDQTYKLLVKWTVGEIFGLGRGELKEISILCDTDGYAHAQYRLTLNEREIFKDKRLQDKDKITFPSNELQAGDKLELEVKSDDGTAIVVDAIIAGAEMS